MIRYLSASEVYPIVTQPLPNGVLGIDDKGIILEVLTAQQAQERGITDVMHHEGVLVPGFINTHCHLELSHLLGKVPLHTGLVGFVLSVVKHRQASEEHILTAMQQADAQMWANGIVAVGDIANQRISKGVKEKSVIYYHTFVEIMGFNPAKADEMIEKALQIKQDFEPLPTSIVPHAPYSVSENLFQRIKEQSEQSILSIHNQESEAENLFFKSKKGDFLSLYQALGLVIDFFVPSGKTALQTYLPWLANQQNTLLVHNTFTTKADIEFVRKHHHHLFWCLCPNANLYIENKLPDVDLLRREGVKITLGTDSLASNHRLSILEEMKTLRQHYPIDVNELLRWATLNGAEFLGISNQFGSFEIGKQPGINLMSSSTLDHKTTIKKII